jgi:hypothetical protein
MIRFLAILAVILFVAKTAYQLLLPGPVSTVSTLSPDEQLRNIVAAHSATAEQLCTLCDSYPQLAAKYLRNGTPIHLSGTVEDFRVAGLDGRRAGIKLCQAGRRPLVAVYDLDHYAVLGLDPVDDHRIHYLVVGNELFKVTPPGIYHRGAHSIEIEEEIRKLIFTRATPYGDTVTLTAINPSAILVAATAK